MTSERKNGSLQNDFPHQLANVLGADVGRLRAYFSLFENAFVQGALSTKVKRLIALAVAIVEGSTETVAFPVQEAVNAGASIEEISEVVTVAVLLAGVPSILVGLEVLASAKQIEAQKLLSVDRPSNAQISRG